MSALTPDDDARLGRVVRGALQAHEADRERRRALDELFARDPKGSELVVTRDALAAARRRGDAWHGATTWAFVTMGLEAAGQGLGPHGQILWWFAVASGLIALAFMILAILRDSRR